MNPELIAEFDAARQALDALAASCMEDRPSIEERLTRDLADLKLHGIEGSWHERWVYGPLHAIRTIEGLRLKLMVELEEARHDLRGLEAELSLLREAGVHDTEHASRRAVRLLCHEADVRERLAVPIASVIPLARNGVARILEVSLRHAGREALNLARESAGPGAAPSLAVAALEGIEAYNRLVAEAHRVTGGVNVPVFLPDYVARVREAVRPAVAAEDSEPPEEATARGGKGAVKIVPRARTTTAAPAAPAPAPRSDPSPFRPSRARAV
jgi:hypothetical protein